MQPIPRTLLRFLILIPLNEVSQWRCASRRRPCRSGQINIRFVYGAEVTAIRKSIPVAVTNIGRFLVCARVHVVFFIEIICRG